MHHSSQDAGDAVEPQEPVINAVVVLALHDIESAMPVVAPVAVVEGVAQKKRRSKIPVCECPRCYAYRQGKGGYRHTYVWPECKVAKEPAVDAEAAELEVSASD